MKKFLLTITVVIALMTQFSSRVNAQQLCGAGMQYVIGNVTPNGASVSFYDSSYAAGTITSWSWSFGNGTGSTLQNPTGFLNPGYNIVCLTITAIFQNQLCTSTVCDTILIGPPQPFCDATFSYVQSPAGVQFSGTGGINVSWSWSFGDGTSGTGINPVHVYAFPGTFQVCLVATNSNGVTCTSCQTIIVGAGNCSSYFTFSQLPGTTQLNFTNQSTGNPTNYLWSFGDGTSSTLQNPLHTYTGLGPYIICLTISDSSTNCYDTFCDSISFNGGGCQSFFTATGNPANNIATFTNTSNAPSGSSYLWDFGDSTTSTQASPSHNYSSPGTYLVCLYILDANGVTLCSYCTNVVVGGNLNCQASFTWAADTLGGIQFTNTSTGNPTNFSYTFNNGATSTSQDPYVQFNSSGWYNVCLTIWIINGSCQSTYCDSIYVTVPNSGNCSSNFAIYPDSVILHTYYAYNLATGVGPLTYTWSWGDGTSSNTAYPSHTYSQGGLYTICLTITDATGCTSNTCYQWQLLRLSGSIPVTINVLPGTTGINEQPLINVISVYPNPATDIIYASFDLSRKSEVSVKIMNLSGQVVHTQPAQFYQVGSHKIEFNATGLAKGMYLVEIQSEGQKLNRKIVVQ